jgi:ESCRT-I complex subunit TSG101
MAAIAPLRAQQAALQNAHARLQAELGELQQLDAALASNEQVLKGAMVEADRVMEDARRRKAPDVDDVLVAPTVVGGQLYTLAAEEKGIADALFILGRALDRGRITPDVFVKVFTFLGIYCIGRLLMFYSKPVVLLASSS